MAFSAQRSYFATGLALLLAWTLLACAGVAQARPVSIVVGSCRFEVDSKNVGIVDELGSVCGDHFDNMRAQLGAPRLVDLIPVRVVVRAEDLRGAAPDSVGVPSWASAYAVPSLPLVVVALRSASGAPNIDLRVSLAHELSHVALYQALGGRRTPRWFSEGVAIQQSETFPIERFLVLLSAARSGRLLPLSSLEQYPVYGGHVSLAYAQAADFVGYLLRREGYLGLRYAVRRYAEGDSFEEAMAAAFREDIASLEKLWIRGLPTTATWIQLLTSEGMLWGLVSLLFVLAYFGARKRHRLVMAKLAAEDEVVDLYWSTQTEKDDNRYH
jgi:hypothetical protein